MVYFVIAEIKFDLNITGTVFDSAITTNWGPKADDKVDNEIVEIIEKTRRRVQYPDTPLIVADVTPTIVSASNHFVKAFYYRRIRNEVLQKEEEGEASKDILAFVKKLKVSSEFYIRIAR